VGALALAAASCNAVPTAVSLPPLDVVIATGDGQFGVVGQELGAPLRVVVRSAATGSPRKDISVIWEVTQGAASVIGVPTTVSDSTGSTEVRLQLGATPGEVRVRASVSGQRGANASFQLFGVNRPTLQQIAPTSAAAGDTVTLTGSNFSTLVDQNVVLFSGFRGRVVSATASELRVEIPRCLPARSVHARVQLGVVPSLDSAALTITGGGQVTSMQPRDVVDVADDSGLSCVALAGGAGAQYLVLAYSASTVGAARHPFTLTALSSVAPLAAAAQAPHAPSAPGFAGRATDPQAAWDQRVREIEGRQLAARATEPAAMPGGAPGPSRVGPAAVPAVGVRDTFNVLNASGGFDRVVAVAQYVGTEAAIFVDETAPTGGLTTNDLESLSDRFDQVIHPEVTAAFGATSDLDANQRVIILLTPSVNRLTPRGSSGFIGGFFYGVDLLPTAAGSNSAEIFYALVPDPTGQHSDAHTTAQVLAAVPAVLAHEFQHMVHFNERVLVRGAGGQEALWLSEGLAQMAEELVARAYAVLGDATSRDLFREGARQRARRYVVGPDTVSVVVTAGQGSLPERGAGFLHVLYLDDQLGTDVLGGLTRTTLTGVANVEAETGMDWSDLLANWWAATWLDGPSAESGPLVYPTVDLKGLLSPFPLVPVPVGPGDASSTGSLWSSSVRYHIVSPPSGGTMSLRLGGAAGGPSSLQAEMRLRIVRLP
jgi:hypothetical protein